MLHCVFTALLISCFLEDALFLSSEKSIFLVFVFTRKYTSCNCKAVIFLESAILSEILIQSYSSCYNVHMEKLSPPVFIHWHWMEWQNKLSEVTWCRREGIKSFIQNFMQLPSPFNKNWIFFFYSVSYIWTHKTNQPKLVISFQKINTETFTSQTYAAHWVLLP